VLIAIIGPRWMDLLSHRADSGERDFVHDEIAAALKRDIVVIPVLTGREGHMPSLPRKDSLPEDIRDLVLYQKHNIAHESFGRDAAELIAAISAVLADGRGPRPWRSIAVLVAIGLALATFSITWLWSNSQQLSVQNVSFQIKKAAVPATLSSDPDGKATALRDGAAMYDLGLQYENARGVTQDFAQARQWYEKAAGQGNAGAMRRLALFYAQGRGGPQDYAQALNWYEGAAALGDADALTALLNLCQGFSLSDSQVRVCYEKAAGLGSASAMFDLGALYEDGHHVNRNPDQARNWYQRAANVGYQPAREKLKAFK
jgi:hypothetical protein